MKADIKLGPEEVLEIIKDHITRTTNHKVNEVRINVDPGFNDRFVSKSPYLKEIVVSVDLENKAVYNEAPRKRIV